MPTTESEPLVVFSTLSAKELLLEIVPRFERETARKVAVTYRGGSVLVKELLSGSEGDLFIGPEGFTADLIAKGVLRNGTQQQLARSTTGLAVRADVPKPDTRTAESVKQLLLSARTVCYSAGASGIHFVQLLQQYGIAEAVSHKTVMPKPGELVGAVVARGEADVGLQQISELLSVAGIQVLDLPPEFHQTIMYSATSFTAAIHKEAAQLFLNYLRSDAIKPSWRRKGLDPL